MEIIDAYIEHLRRTNCSEQTQRDRRGILNRLNRALPYGLGVVSYEDLATWLHREDWSQNTRATYFRGLRSFYSWAADPADPWISSDPTARLERVPTAESISRACTDEQLEQILTRAREPYLTWAKLAAYQGLRCIEISRLDREHVTDRQLFVVKGKGGRPRVHDTDPAVWAAVKDLPPGPVARRAGGERESALRVSTSTRDYFADVIKVPVSLHQLRHWLGNTVQREYRDIRVTMAVLGHRSMASTQIYTAATDEQQRAARATLPRFGA